MFIDDPINRSSVRHIDIRFLFVRETFEKENFVAEHIPGEDNPADMFTKPLGPTKLSKFAAIVLNLPVVGAC